MTDAADIRKLMVRVLKDSTTPALSDCLNIVAAGELDTLAKLLGKDRFDGESDRNLRRRIQIGFKKRADRELSRGEVNYTIDDDPTSKAAPRTSDFMEELRKVNDE